MSMVFLAVVSWEATVHGITESDMTEQLHWCLVLRQPLGNHESKDHDFCSWGA